MIGPLGLTPSRRGGPMICTGTLLLLLLLLLLLVLVVAGGGAAKPKAAAEVVNRNLCILNLCIMIKLIDYSARP